uniref:Uncharacterized protein n=1 Tax=Loxodonta africana TaxID=9785 RepID=G3U2V3_LOXAF
SSPLQEGCLWPLDSSVSRQGVSEVRGLDKVTKNNYFAQRERFGRFQPTFPYLRHEIDLPPTISLSDGRGSRRPTRGPCALQLRDPEQQRELNRESVRAPPNRTVFDSDRACSPFRGGPCPPSCHSGVSAAACGSNGHAEGPPPAYSEVVGHGP